MKTTTTTNPTSFQNAIGRDEVEILLAALARVTVHGERYEAMRASLVTLFEKMEATLESVNGDDEDLRYFTITLEPNDESKAS